MINRLVEGVGRPLALLLDKPIPMDRRLTAPHQVLAHCTPCAVFISRYDGLVNHPMLNVDGGKLFSDAQPSGRAGEEHAVIDGFLEGFEHAHEVGVGRGLGDAEMKFKILIEARAVSIGQILKPIY